MSSDDFRALGDEPFVLLTTFRRTGEPVPTPVWIVRDGDRLLVTTVANSGKVKRIGHTARIELVASDRVGVVAEGAPVFVAEARVDDSDEVRSVLDDALVAKYGDRYREVRSAREASRPDLRSTALVITEV